MLDFDYTEKRFEQDIEESLLIRDGYLKGASHTFDRAAAPDVSSML